MKNKSIKYLWGSFFCFLFLFSCQDTDELSKEIDHLKDRTATLEAVTKSINTSLESLQALLKADIIVGVTSVGDNYRIELNDGSTIDVVQAAKVNLSVPQLSIDKDGYWVVSTDRGTTFNPLKDENGNKIPATAEVAGLVSVTPVVKVDNDGYWIISTDGGKTFDFIGGADNKQTAVGTDAESTNSIFSNVKYDSEKQILSITLPGGQTYKLPCMESFYLRVLGTSEQQLFPLSEKRIYQVEQNEVSEASIIAPDGWKVDLEENQLTIISPANTDREKELKIKIVCTSIQGYLRTTTIPVKLLTTTFGANTCTSWQEFINKDAKNVLLDFSYAGYKHGEMPPPETKELIAQGYKVYNVKDYGAIPGDSKSDRGAVIKILKELGATFTEADNGKTENYTKNNPGKAIIYFPEGEYILQGAEDPYQTLRISMSDFVIKGAGRDKTIIKKEVMSEEGEPGDMWSGPTMLNIKHNSGLSKLADVTADAAVGTFSVTLNTTSGINTGDWVCLKLVNNSQELIAQELSPYPNVSSWTDINNTGIQIYDYHQVKEKNGNIVTFYEPLMHKVESKWGWSVEKFPHYENIGVEDLTFEGKAKDKFVHHASGADDSGYKMIDFGRLTNSWMRRVNFTSVSEASSLQSCVNCSAYDIRINGNRGHAAIRSQASSRIFIGKVVDESDGYEEIDRNGNISDVRVQGIGQFHACGVSKQSMGAVIWNVKWGKDACFESHATQPRATLIDRCTGTFMPFRQGGDWSQLPNHWENLTIWNMNATKVSLSYFEGTWQGKFKWWDNYWNFLKPVIVGFHGQNITFDETQMTRNESCGVAVEPYSLYEAQLRQRLGYVPAWLNSLK